jgi:hypothetical protein
MYWLLSTVRRAVTIYYFVGRREPPNIKSAMNRGEFIDYCQKSVTLYPSFSPFRVPTHSDFKQVSKQGNCVTVVVSSGEVFIPFFFF